MKRQRIHSADGESLVHWLGPALGVRLIVGLAGVLVCLAFVVPSIASALTPRSITEQVGEAAGELDLPDGVAVDPSTGDIYVGDDNNARVSEFDSAGAFVRAFGFGVRSLTSGHGDISAGEGTGNLTSGSTTVEDVVASRGAFAVGQQVSDTGVPNGTTIVAVGVGTLELSSAATVSANDVSLRAGSLTITGVTTQEGAFAAGQVIYSEEGAIFGKEDGAIFGKNEPGVLITAVGPGTITLAEPVSVPYDERFVESLTAVELQSCTAASGCRKGQGGSAASTAGQLSFAQSIAVDPQSHDVYVFDEGRVDKFDSEGHFLLAIEGLEVSGIGAPDGPIAVDSEGDLWVGGHDRLARYSSSGKYLSELALPGAGFTYALATGPNGALYVASAFSSQEGRLRPVPGIRRFTIEPEPQPPAFQYSFDTSGTPFHLATDAGGNVFASEAGGFSEFSATNGTEIERFGEKYVTSGEETNAGIAVGDTANILYASAVRGEGSLVAFPLSLPGRPLLEGEGSEGLTSSTVTLAATLDPENHATTYRFEYGTKPGVYEHSSTPVVLPGSGFAEEAVQAHLSGLLPETTYHFRLVATNYCNEADPSEECTVDGEGGSFTTLPAVDIESQSTLDVTSTSAAFEGVLNPLSATAQWWVEYGTQEGVFEHSTAGIPLASGSAGQDVGTNVQGLEPATIYYYRFVGSDEREGHSYTSYGQTLSFTTQVAGGEFSLPDGREWELVSTFEKLGVSIEGQNAEGSQELQTAADGDAITYTTDGPVEYTPSGYSKVTQVFSRREPGGWSSQDIDPPHSFQIGNDEGIGKEYKLFSGDLSLALIQPFGPFTALSPEASERTPYLRDNNVCKSQQTECYTPLVTTGNIPAGMQFGGESQFGDEFRTSFIQMESATSDLSHIVLHADANLLGQVALTQEALEAKAYEALYEWSGGHLQAISVLPESEGGQVINGRIAEIAKENGSVITESALHAISDDGSRVFWTNEEESHHGLFMRDMVSGETVKVSSGGEFETASSDGSSVFYREGGNKGSSGGALYECEFIETAGKLSCATRDLTTPENLGETAEVGGVVGTSEDGSYVYFTAKGTFAPGAIPGGANLYLDHGGVTQLIAVLSPGDVDTGTGRVRGGAVSPDGRWLAFMSRRSLTGYDNRDAASGEPDAEVFLYHAPAGGGEEGKLMCASCNPSGARPSGFSVSSGVGSPDYAVGNKWTNQWLAGVLPVEPRSRYLSDSGRLFFNSSDSLVPQDVNGAVDVYEYEPVGVPAGSSHECTIQNATFSARSGGCVGLISSGRSLEESAFLGASETGGDVFFLTSEDLVPQDEGSEYEIYDAHECTAGSPCPPSAPVSAPVCETEASCRAAPSPQPAIYGAPASATFVGAGNVVSGSTTTVARKASVKALTRAQKLTRALAACKRGPKRSRKACERRAQRAYGGTNRKATHGKTKRAGKGAR